MKTLRILVLVHPSLVPPESTAGLTDQQIDDWRTEFDVITTLRTVGHEVRCLGVLDSLTELRTAITEWRPDVVFNLLEEFNGIVTYDQHVVAFLELMQQPRLRLIPRVVCWTFPLCAALGVGVAQQGVNSRVADVQNRCPCSHAPRSSRHAACFEDPKGPVPRRPRAKLLRQGCICAGVHCHAV